MTELAMFPLGSVLMPHMPLPLRVFEPRYLRMLAEILPDDSPSFGVTLIERGAEVGGGDVRFAVGTVAEVVEMDADADLVVLIARGSRRIAIERWLPDDPYPRAEVRVLDELAWDGDAARLDAAERAVRRAISVASEYGRPSWTPDIELDEDPVARAWQIAGIAPIGALDSYELLAAGTVEELLEGVVERTAAALDMLRFRAGSGSGPGDPAEGI